MYFDKKAQDTLFEKKIILKGKLYNLKNKLKQAGVDNGTIGKTYRLVNYSSVRLGEDDIRRAIEALQKIGAINRSYGRDPRWILSKTKRFLALQALQRQRQVLEEARNRIKEREAEQKQNAGKQQNAARQERQTRNADTGISSGPMRMSLARAPSISQTALPPRTAQILTRPPIASLRSPISQSMLQKPVRSIGALSSYSRHPRLAA